MVPATDAQRPEATRLGSYEILRKLARGGMAELFLARTVGPENFEKLVVLKKILPNFAENPKFVRLFLDEARLAATLDHPHIAHVYDMGKVEGNYFFTMEYIHGQDLRATLRRTARLEKMFPLDHAVQIVHAVASALHYAHERRKPDGSLLDIVHRDVSPSNVLISYDGAIKLVDFGVAKAATSTSKTRTGTLKGKIAYMSPEQAKGSNIDRRSDIFSLGILLWETITTQRLFRGENDLATIQMIINETPARPSTLQPACPEELERIVMKALANDPDKRYQTAEELQLDLEEFAREQKLKQSTVALRSHMQDLFADEIRAWKSAQASGLTLTDHVVSASVVEMTTPVSENEVSFLEDDDDEEDLDDASIQQPTQGSLDETTQGRPVHVTPPEVPIPKVLVGRVDQTPAPQGTPAAPLAITPSGAMRQAVPPPMPHVASGPVRQIHHSESQPVIAPHNAYPREPTAFPIAPKEWRSNNNVVARDQPKQDHRRLIIYSLLGCAVLAVILLATGGGTPPPTAAAIVQPTPVETGSAAPVDMNVEAPRPTPPKPEQPPTVVTAGSATTPTPTPTTATTPKPVDKKKTPPTTSTTHHSSQRKDVNPPPRKYDQGSNSPSPLLPPE